MDLLQAIFTIVPWLLFALLLYFTLLLISYVYGVFQAKKKDQSLKRALSKTGRIILTLEVLIYFTALVISIFLFINQLKLNNNIMNAISIFNPLTLYTLVFALHIQDVIYLGKKKILIGTSLFEYRRMKKITYPKKNKISFIYGQKQYNVSLFFTDITEFKKKINK
jgi:hypothetical protein